MEAMAPLAPDDEFLCFGDRRAFETWQPEAANTRLIEVAQRESPTIAAAADGNRAPDDMFRLSRAVSRQRPDVFFSPSVYTYFPLPPRLPAVVTVHDTIAEQFPALTLPSRRARLFWHLKVRLAIRQACLILTVSEYSARSIERILGVPRHRIRVSGEAPSPAYGPSSVSDARAAAARAGVPEGSAWFIYVGGFNPHKRLDTIIDAHARIARESAHPPMLLLVGAVAGDVFLGEAARLRERIREVGTEPLVRWTGFVPDAELRHLSSGAVALLLPSEVEGFGLPAIEAAACGTPVVATRESPLPELLEGGGYFVTPGDVGALETAMRSLLGDPALRASMGDAARRRTATMTWRVAARAALDAIREAAA